MNTGLISSRYAYSLLEFSIENREQKEVYNKMKLLSDLYIHTPLLKRTIHDRSLRRSEKKKLLVTACGNNIPDSLDKMFDLILKNEREEIIQFIALQFVKLYRERFKIQHGKITTAYPMKSEELDYFVSRIQKIINESIEIDEEVDPKIIGGFILQLGDYRWDASLSGEFSRIKKQIRGVEENIKIDR